jgi:hypothetical protein
VRGLERGAWWQLIRRSSVAIAGFGYFGERAEVDGVTCYNTSVSGTGDRYPDANSVTLKSEDNYLLLTFKKGGPMLAELKNLRGQVLDSKEIEPRGRGVQQP